MTASLKSFSTEIDAGHFGPPIPAPKLAYLQQRLRNRMLNFFREKFAVAKQGGLTKAQLARRIGKTPDVINRWLSSPSNLTSDTICDLLIGISGEEFFPEAHAIGEAQRKNYSHFSNLRSSAYHPENNQRTSTAYSPRRSKQPQRSLTSAAQAAACPDGQQHVFASALGKRQPRFLGEKQR